MQQCTKFGRADFLYLSEKGRRCSSKRYTLYHTEKLDKGVIPEAFKLDPKITLPKPGKSEYNSVRSYHPITLESTIGKVMERVVCKRLVWKLEVEGGVASTQYAYRRQ